MTAIKIAALLAIAVLAETLMFGVLIVGAIFVV